MAWAAAACTGIQRTDVFRGSCEDIEERCKARCDEARDGRVAHDCRVACEMEARRCSARQGEVGAKSIGVDVDPRKKVAAPGATEIHTVSFAKGRIESSGFHVATNGPVRAAGTAYELMPGGSLQVAFSVPPDTRGAELVIEHGAGGGGIPCFITVALADKPFLARYMPPRRTGESTLKTERWDLTTQLPPRGAEGGPRQPLRLFLYNNAQAQSQAPYYIRVVELRTGAAVRGD